MLLGVLALAAFTVTQRFYTLAPGGAWEIGPRLEIPATQKHELGQLFFVAVQVRRAHLEDLLLAAIGRPVALVPVEAIRPPGASPADVQEMNRRLLTESEQVAALVAMRAAGYPASIRGDGAAVHAVMPGAPADGVLQPGDTIVAVDGARVETATDAVEKIRRHQVGDTVNLTVLRDGELQEMRLVAEGAPDEPQRPAIGAAVSTKDFEVDLPFDVHIQTDNVGGASAGLMFSLGILDGVTSGMLTRGHVIAGTGTVATDGTVGPIGGAGLKVVSAREAGATIFLVPRENLEEARRFAQQIEMVPVDRFADAVRYLCGLPPTGDASGTPEACTLALAQ
jgi:PDZ domain-containing protein